MYCNIQYMNKWLWTFLIFFGYSLCYSSEYLAITTIQEYLKTTKCQIQKVDDGDTFNILCTDWYYTNVRLLGVNTPDIDLSSNIADCYYQKAKEYVQKRIGIPYNVTFYWSDLCKDPYKGCRNLVRLEEQKTGKDLGQDMILNWYAFSWTTFSMVPEGIREIYNWMERISFQHHIGLWNECKIQHNNVSGIDSSIPDKMTNTEITPLVAMIKSKWK